MNSQIAKKDYDQFCYYLERHSGIVLGANKEYLVKSRLSGVFKSHRIDNLRLLLDELERNTRTPLKQLVIDAMTTNETSWFRDTYPYNMLMEQLFSAQNSGRSRLRIWSAACSTGQEPYSISMLFEEWLQHQQNQTSSLDIVATDLSLGVLSAAQSGCYDNLSIKRGLSEKRRSRFFQHHRDNCWQISPHIQQRVKFKPLNLLDSFTTLGQFDAIFCRNVLIYFSDDVKRDIFQRLHQVLKPKGLLFLGGSEPCSRSDLFEMECCYPGILYRAI